MHQKVGGGEEEKMNSRVAEKERDQKEGGREGRQEDVPAERR
jgi:hypothetical protein